MYVYIFYWLYLFCELVDIHQAKAVSSTIGNSFILWAKLLKNY